MSLGNDNADYFLLCYVTLSFLAIQVEYDVSGFLDKNRDTLPPSVQMLMKSKHFIVI